LPASSGHTLSLLCRLVLAGASRLVPTRLRSEWRQEWEAELWYRLQALRARDDLGPRTQVDLLARCLGAWRHAGWLFTRQLGSTAPARESMLALRLLARTPFETGLIVLALGLGIGLVATTLTLTHAALLRPLPYHDAQRLATIYNRAPAAGLPRIPLSDLEFLTIRRESRSLAGVAAFRAGTVRLDGPSGGRALHAARVTEDFFSMIRPAPAVGRWLGPDDFTDSTVRVVLGHALWESWFGGDPGVVGRTILVDGAPVSVVGVAPKAFVQPLEETEIWTPLRLGAPLQPGARAFRVIGVRHPNVSEAAATAELNRISRELQTTHPQVYFGAFGARWEVVLERPRPAGVRAEVGSLVLLLGAAGLTLAAVLAAVAGHSALRRRGSVGATVALAGGCLGLVLTAAGLETLRGLLPGWLPGVSELRLDWRAVAASVAAGILALLTLPRARAACLAMSFAGLVPLLATATLATLAYERMRSTSPGFEAAGVLAIPAGWRPDRYRSLGAMATHLAAEPYVEAVSRVSAVPLAQPSPAVTFDLEGRDQRPGEEPTSAELSVVDANYFGLMRIPLEAGRGFRPTDDATPSEVVVSRAMADRFWPGQGAVGQRLRVYLLKGGPTTPWLTVVGIVGDVGGAGSERSAGPTFYLPAALDSTRLSGLLVRIRDASGDRLLGRIAPQGAGDGPVPVSRLLERTTAPRRNAAFALDLMAALALCSAAAAARLVGRRRRAAVPAFAGLAAGVAVLWLLFPRIAGVLLPPGPIVPAAAALGILLSTAAAALVWSRGPSRYQAN
jgi:hypothetical protein